MHRDNWRGQSDADPHWSGLPRWGRFLIESALRAWTFSPWAALAFAGAAVALHRWPGLLGEVSAGVCAGTASTGWWLLWRSAERELDVSVATHLRVSVPEPEPWALFWQAEERTAAAHTHRCLHRWGVSPRSSGWERLAARTRAWWRREAAVALLFCAPLSVHPWWLWG